MMGKCCCGEEFSCGDYTGNLTFELSGYAGSGTNYSPVTVPKTSISLKSWNGFGWTSGGTSIIWAPVLFESDYYWYQFPGGFYRPAIQFSCAPVGGGISVPGPYGVTPAWWGVSGGIATEYRDDPTQLTYTLNRSIVHYELSPLYAEWDIYANSIYFATVVVYQ